MLLLVRSGLEGVYKCRVFSDSTYSMLAYIGTTEKSSCDVYQNLRRKPNATRYYNRLFQPSRDWVNLFTTGSTHSRVLDVVGP